MNVGFPPYLPAELLEEILSANDAADIRSASLVCQRWRAVALRFLFTRAEFSLQEDFARWKSICDALPSVATTVREVLFCPGSRCDAKAVAALTARYSHYKPVGWEKAFLRELLPALPSPDMVVPPSHAHLPTMPLVRRFTWNNGRAASSLGSCAFQESTDQFFTAFPHVQELNVSGSFDSVQDFLKLVRAFPATRWCSLSNIDITGRCRRDPTPDMLVVGGLQKVEKLSLSFDDPCKIDWLVDDILRPAGSALREVELEYEIPFSPSRFLRLLDVSSDSLETLSIPPPVRDRRGWAESRESFNATAFPVLRVVKFDTIHTGGKFDPVLSLEWVTLFIDSLPSTPQLRTLHVFLYAADPSDFETFLEDGASAIHGLSAMVGRLDCVETLIMELLMETQFDTDEIGTIDQRLRSSLAALGDKVVVRWTDENPKSDGQLTLSSPAWTNVE